MDKPDVQTLTGRRRARPARTPRVDGTSTRTQILEAARRRLVEQGYANLSVRDIAADAGVNHALIGYHFQGKQQLVLAVLDEANTRLLERQTRMYDADAPLSVKWKQACEFYEEDLASGFVRLIMELMGASFHDEQLRREFTPRMLAWKQLIETATERFIAEAGLDLPVSARAISAWVTWFWFGLEAGMTLGIPESEGNQREALAAITSLIERAEAAAARRKRRKAP
jgi:AcrR family transcriptional regulator